MANFTLCYFGSVILFSVGASYSLFECDVFPAVHVVGTDHDKVINTLNCSTTKAAYSFFTKEKVQQLGTKVTCKSSDTGKVHSFIDPLRPVNLKMGFVNYSSLQPSLPADKLPDGSECQLYGCTLSADDTGYMMFEGEKCNISHPAEPKECNSCPHQESDVQIIAASIVLLTVFVLLLCLLTWIGLKYYMSRHYRGMLHCINVSENEMFDADSELVKVGTDSPPATTIAICASLNSLDLIEPLGKSSEELGAVDFIDNRKLYNQKPCVDGATNKGNGSEEFCLQLQAFKFPTPIQENSVQQNQIDSFMTTNHKTVLTNINADGYVCTQLLSCTEV